MSNRFHLSPTTLVTLFTLTQKKQHLLQVYMCSVEILGGGVWSPPVPVQKGGSFVL